MCDMHDNRQIIQKIKVGVAGLSAYASSTSKRVIWNFTFFCFMMIKIRSYMTDYITCF